MRINFINQNYYQKNISNMPLKNKTNLLNNCQLHSKLNYSDTVVFKSSGNGLRGTLKMLPKYYELENIKYEKLSEYEKAFSEAMSKLVQCTDDSPNVKEIVSDFKKTYRFALSDVYDDSDNISKSRLTYILASMIDGLDNSNSQVASDLLYTFIFGDILSNMDIKNNSLDKVLLTYTNAPILKNAFLKISLSDALTKANIS